MEDAMDMEVEVELEAEEHSPSSSNPSGSSFRRFGLKNSIQTNFGSDYVFEITPKCVISPTCPRSISLFHFL